MGFFYIIYILKGWRRRTKRRCLNIMRKLIDFRLYFLIQETWLSPKTRCIGYWPKIFCRIIWIFIFYYCWNDHWLYLRKRLFILSLFNKRIAFFAKVIIRLSIIIKYSPPPRWCPLENLDIWDFNRRFRLNMRSWKNKWSKLLCITFI